MSAELTADDIKNGWTAESLAAYHAERQKAHDGIIAFNPDYRRAPMPLKANGKYRPLRMGRK